MEWIPIKNIYIKTWDNTFTVLPGCRWGMTLPSKQFWKHNLLDSGLHGWKADWKKGPTESQYIWLNLHRKYQLLKNLVVLIIAKLTAEDNWHHQAHPNMAVLRSYPSHSCKALTHSYLSWLRVQSRHVKGPILREIYVSFRHMKKSMYETLRLFGHAWRCAWVMGCYVW